MTQLRDLMAKLQQLDEADTTPTTFTPTHFHKGNLGNINPLMLHTDGKFYHQTQQNDPMRGQTGTVIAPWNFGPFNPEDRSAMNPASIDGVYQDGKPVEFPQGVTWKTYKQTTAQGQVDQSGKAAADPNKEKMVARFKELLIKAGVLSAPAVPPASLAFDPKVDLNPQGAPAIRLKANEEFEFKSLIGKALLGESILNEELTKAEYSELSKLFGELSVTYKDDASLAPLFAAYDKVKPVWAPAPVDTPAPAPASGDKKGGKKLLPVDPRVQQFQDAVVKANPKALPKYGADGRLGSETQAEIDRNPELAKKFGLVPSTAAPKGDANTPKGDANTPKGDPKNPKAASDRPASIKHTINGKEYTMYLHTDGYYYIPGEKIPRTPDGWSRMNTDPKLDAARAAADKLPPPFPKGYTGAGTPSSTEQSGKYASQSSALPPETADSNEIGVWLKQNVPNAKSGDKYWVHGKRFEFVVSGGRGGVTKQWQENKPFTLDNNDPDYKRETFKYSGPQGGPKDMVASTWERNAYEKRQSAQASAQPEQSGKEAGEPRPIDVRIRNLERQIAGLQSGTFKDEQIAKLNKLKAERDSVQQSGKTGPNGEPLTKNPRTGNLGYYQRNGRTQTWVDVKESVGYSEDQTLASIVHLAGLR